MKQVYMALLALLLFSCSTKTKQTGKNIEPPAASNDLAYQVKDTESLQLASQLSDQKQTAGYIGETQEPKPGKTISQKKESSFEHWEKKIIKTAEIDLELSDYKKYNQSLHESLKAYGAYVAAEEQVSANDKLTNNVTIKVPVAQFENLVNSFSGEGIKVLQKKISSDDVTEEMVDTKSRLEARKQMRDRYLDLLKQAKNMKEILEVQTEINSIQEEIESAEGRASYLSHQSSYSTVHLSYYQFIDGAQKPGDTNGFSYQLKDGFKNGVRIIGALFIFAVSLWPVILVATIGIFIWKRKKQVRPQS